MSPASITLLNFTSALDIFPLNELSQIYRKHENNISSLNGMGGAWPMGGGEWENIYMNQISC